MKVSDTKADELGDFVRNSKSCTKSGLHNPFKSPERYIMYGTVCAEAAAMLRKRDVQEFFIKLIQRVAPKSYTQAKAELHVTERFLQNFSGDQVRFLARAFQIPGDHAGQLSTGYRWPYGPVAIIAPFNFPIEIPILQLMGALFMGNKVIIKGDSRVSVVLEQTIRLLHHCGMPKAVSHLGSGYVFIQFCYYIAHKLTCILMYQFTSHVALNRTWTSSIATAP